MCRMKKLPGVYLLRNMATFDSYVGSTNSLSQRKRAHLYDLRHNKAYNLKMQADFIEYGEEVFDFIVLEEISDEKELIRKEQLWMDRIKPTYNINKIAGKSFHENSMTKEALEKRRLKMLGREKSESEIEKQRNSMIKRFKERKDHPLQMMTLEQKQENGRKGALALMEKGYKHNANTKKKIGDSNAKTYHGFIDPNGNIYSPVHNLKQFCEAHELVLSSMVAIDHERRSHHKGWRKLK